MKTVTNRFTKNLILFESILLVPLVGMQFTSEVDWTIVDFFIMGVLLLGLAILTEIVLRSTQHRTKRIYLIGFAVILFLLIWAELAVGLFGTPFSGN